MWKKKKKSEGILALERIQSGKYEPWKKEEIEKSDLSETEKKILYFIDDENSRGLIPSFREIESELQTCHSTLHSYMKNLKTKEMAFNITPLEIFLHYRMNYRNGTFYIPDRLKWLRNYSDEIGGIRYATINQRAKNPRKIYLRWVRNLKVYDLPSYEYLGLHITPEQLKSIIPPKTNSNQ